MPILHIVNGDSTRMGLERSSVPGTFSSWSDILYEGPTPAHASPEDWRRARVAYLASQGFGQEPEIAEQYRREDAALERWADHDEVVLWCEHDLYDQLILIRHLAWIGRARGGEGAMGARGAEGATGAGAAGAAGAGATGAGAAGAPTRFSLVCDDTYLGPLKPEQFPPLFGMREPITDAQIDLGTRAWSAFCGDDPRAILPFASTPSRDLPFLPGALHRYLEEFPSVGNGLSRSEAQILRSLSDGESSPDDLFGALVRTEARIFMGDSSFWAIVRRLSEERHPLLTLDVRDRPHRLPAGTLRITDAGRDVASGRADRVALNGIDRWMGGVYLSPSRCWRWTGGTLIIAD